MVPVKGKTGHVVISAKKSERWGDKGYGGNKGTGKKSLGNAIENCSCHPSGGSSGLQSERTRIRKKERRKGHGGEGMRRFFGLGRSILGVKSQCTKGAIWRSRQFWIQKGNFVMGRQLITHERGRLAALTNLRTDPKTASCQEKRNRCTHHEESPPWTGGKGRLGLAGQKSS